MTNMFRSLLQDVTRRSKQPSGELAGAAALQSSAVQTIEFKGHTIKYETPNDVAAWRVKTLFQKEPDTIQWIDQFKAGEVMVDIGANVGMYTMLAARASGVNVFAFEPESQNYALLNRNIAINGLQGQVTAYCLALSDEITVDELYLSGFQLGSSCHSFGQDIDHQLQARNSRFAQGCVSWTLDSLVANGDVPVPDHIKIDVDGLEHKVIEGAKTTFMHPGLKSVLVEINLDVPQHQAVLDLLSRAGFIYSLEQLTVAIRKEGPFANCGNLILWRPERNFCFNFGKPQSAPSIARKFKSPSESDPMPEATRHLTERLEQIEFQIDPFPHCYVENFFPEELYQKILACRPSSESLQTLSESKRVVSRERDGDTCELRRARQAIPELLQRRSMDLTPETIERLPPDIRAFWSELSDWMIGGAFGTPLLRKFETFLMPRIVATGKQFSAWPELLYLRDTTGYEIGPHTDSPTRLFTVFIYLPEDLSQEKLGTSLYKSCDSRFRCPGGPHYNENPNAFERIATMPRRPNSALAFLKTDYSFHGVEPVTDPNVERNSMCYIMRCDPCLYEAAPTKGIEK